MASMMVTNSTWADFYGPTGDFVHLYDRIKALREKHWRKVILPMWSTGVSAHSWRKHHQLCHRTDAVLRRAEHELHMRMGEVGRYLWCDECQGRPHHCFYEQA